MNIGFTGHRNKLTEIDFLDKLSKSYPGWTWIAGGALGFDTQVSGYALSHGISMVTIQPDYGAYGQRAPLVRNDEIVERSDMLVACYDGRIGGGTFYTVRRAWERGIPIAFAPVINVG